MTTEEIIQMLQSRARTPEVYALRQAMVYTLYYSGYGSTHIANVMGMSYNNISYTNNKVADLIASNDPLMLRTLAELEEHKLRLVPYYHFEENVSAFRVRAYLEIDGIQIK